MSVTAPSIIFQGLGSYTPSKILHNNDLAKIVETSDEWIRTRTGIVERRIAAPHETTSSMAVEAAKKAIVNSGIKKEDIDLLIVATMTPDNPFPSTACLVQAQLGLNPITAFDISAACSGFLYTLETATHMLRGGNYRNALIIGSEKISSILDWQDRTTCVLFGDGAGAVVLSKSDKPGIGVIQTQLGSDGNFANLLYMPGGGCALPASKESLEARNHYLKMNGKELFKHAVRWMEQSCLKILEEHNLSIDQIDCVIPHQANTRIIEAIAERLGIPMERFFVNIDTYGNTSAASIPLALYEAHEKGRIRSGNNILLVAFGAGLTWGTSLIKWQ